MRNFQGIDFIWPQTYREIFKSVSVPLNAEKISCNFIGYKNVFWNVGIMHASRLWSFYSINFQIRQIPATNQNFPGKNNPFSISLTVVWVEISEENISFSSLRSCYHRLAKRKKLSYFATRKILQNWTTWSLRLPARNYFYNFSKWPVWVFEAT